jgi:hypothetical protein
MTTKPAFDFDRELAIIAMTRALNDCVDLETKGLDQEAVRRQRIRRQMLRLPTPPAFSGQIRAPMPKLIPDRS